MRFTHISLALGFITTTSFALFNCTSSTTTSTGQNIGVDNSMGLALMYDAQSQTVLATIPQQLSSTQQLLVRVRQGELTPTSQDEVDCSQLTQAPPMANGMLDHSGRTVYQGPQVPPEIFNLLNYYDDAPQDPTNPSGIWNNLGENAADPGAADSAATTGDSQLQQEAQQIDSETAEMAQNGPDAIVEACIVDTQQQQVLAKLQVSLAYAIDQETRDAIGDLNTDSIGGLHINDVPAGAPPPAQGALTEDQLNPNSSQIEYAKVCVDQMGEIPFFPKISDGHYGTFDCRHLAASVSDGTNPPTPVPVPGLEGAPIPLMRNGQKVTQCDPGAELGPESADYGCVPNQKADNGMFLASGAVQPGPMVATATNPQGTHWVLLCRKVADDGSGMTNSETFNDIAMIGNNPRTGRTCFFQNSINFKKDGSKVPHPGDVSQSTNLWSPSVQNYCTGQCHAQNAFVHSPWIDGAKRSNGISVVPKLGEDLPDYPISNPAAFYNLVGGKQLGFTLPPQLVNPSVAACTNCHTLAGNTAGYFAQWSTGGGPPVYWNSMDDYGKQFAQSHWMPPRLGNLTADTFPTSSYGQALQIVTTCMGQPGAATSTGNPNDPTCKWANTPRGDFNNPPIQ